MFTNVSRPSAVDVLRPFAVGDQFYADTTSTLAKRAIGSTNDVLIVSGGVPVWSSTVVLTTLTVVDSGFTIVGSGDATKTLKFEVDAQSAGADLTIDTGAQTVDRTLTVPVLTGNHTLAIIDQAQTFTAAQAISQGTITDPATTLALTSTWNDVADTFTALGINVTDTNSATASKLADFMVGGASRFTVTKAGLMSCVGGITLSGTVQASIGPGLKITGSPSAFTGDGPEFTYSGTRGGMAAYARSISAYRGFDFNALDFAFLISGVSQFTISSSNVSSFTSTTDATSAATGAVMMSGGLNVAKNLIHRQGRGAGITRTATAAGTTTLTSSSTEYQEFTGTTTQTVQFPAANLFGAGISVIYVINNQSTGTVTPTRAGSDTFAGGGTTDPVLAGACTRYASDGISVWLKC